jgi:hypothetical protein
VVVVVVKAVVAGGRGEIELVSLSAATTASTGVWAIVVLGRGESRAWSDDDVDDDGPGVCGCGWER